MGLALFLAIWFFTWRRSAWLAKTTKGRDDLRWASNLVAMVQVSLVGYLVGGAFLDLAYWDLPYYASGDPDHHQRHHPESGDRAGRRSDDCC